MKVPTQFKFKGIFHPHTEFLTLGVVIPAILVWMSHWLIFSMSEKMTTISQFLEKNASQITAVLPDFQLAPYFTNIFFQLNANNGLAYVLLGILLFVFAVVLFTLINKVYETKGVTLGELRFVSILVSILIGLVIVAILVAIFNQLFIYSFPPELIEVFWR